MANAVWWELGDFGKWVENCRKPVFSPNLQNNINFALCCALSGVIFHSRRKAILTKLLSHGIDYVEKPCYFDRQLIIVISMLIINNNIDVMILNRFTFKLPVIVFWLRTLPLYWLQNTIVYITERKKACWSIKHRLGPINWIRIIYSACWTIENPQWLNW